MSKDAVEGNLRQVIRDLQRRIDALERAQNDVGRLDELSSDMGLMTAGEFRSGNGVEPGEGFSGVRMTADGVNGYANDVLQAGLSATTGKLTAGAGDVEISENGISIKAGGTFGLKNSISFVDGGSVVGSIWDKESVISGEHYLIIEQSKVTGFPGYIEVRPNSDSGYASGFSIALYVNNSPVTYHLFRTTETIINTTKADINTTINGTGGAVLTVDAGDNDVDIATKMNFGETGAITGGNKAIDDDGVYSFTPACARGILILRGQGAGSTEYAMVTYAATAGTAYAYAWVNGTNTVITTGALTGTTGTDGKLTISAHTDGKIYIENRRGGSRAVAWNILAGA